MNNRDKVLVVGATSDYIDWIRKECPGRAIFLTDYSARLQAAEEIPPSREEVLADLDDEQQVFGDLRQYLQKWGTVLGGITCFDCESLELTAHLAGQLSLPYPGIDSIRLCRDKYLSKQRWQQNGVRCPRVRPVQSAAAVFSFMEEIDQPCVIKPLTGSGSELVFRCTGKRDCDRWGQVMLRELAARESHRLFRRRAAWFLAEECVSGTEYSCDFLVRQSGVEVIRLTRKIPAEGRPFGTIAGYVLKPYPTDEFDPPLLEQNLHRAAMALGIDHAICMVDFIVSAAGIVLLEMTPRPGGDCIPHLLRRSGRVNTLALAIDFAAGRPLRTSPEQVNAHYVGLRLHARKAGRIIRLDTSRLDADSRIREVQLIRGVGHQVSMPPADYESWYLGHVIFRPYAGIALEQQCSEINRKLVLEVAS